MSPRECYSIARQLAYTEEPKPVTQMGCVAGFETFDLLKAEVLSCIADFVPCERTPISTELDKMRVPHFFYQGVLIVRSTSTPHGFMFV
jgi:hypothetical protein